MVRAAGAIPAGRLVLFEPGPPLLKLPQGHSADTALAASRQVADPVCGRVDFCPHLTISVHRSNVSNWNWRRAAQLTWITRFD